MLLLFIVSISSFFLFRIIRKRIISSFESEQSLLSFAEEILKKNKLFHIQVEISDNKNYIFYNAISNQLLIPSCIANKQNVFYQYWVTVQIYYIQPKFKNRIRNGFVVFLSRHISTFKKILFTLSILTILNLKWGWVDYSYLFAYILPSLLFLIILFLQQIFIKKKIVSLYHQVSSRKIDRFSFFIALHYYLLSFIIAPGGIIWYWKYLFIDNDEN